MKKVIQIVCVAFVFCCNIAFAIDTTSTGFYWPLEIGSSKYAIGGDWLEGDGSPSGNYFEGKYHTGVDMIVRKDKLNVSHGKPVYAISSDCEVASSVPGGVSWGYDNGIESKPNHALFLQCKDSHGEDFGVLYGHVQPTVKPGDSIPKNLIIGYIGSWAKIGGSQISGDHLHFGLFPGKNRPPANSSLGYGWGRMSEKYWPKGGSKNDCESYTFVSPDGKLKVHCTNGFVDPVKFINTHKPQSEKDKVDTAVKQNNLNKVDGYCKNTAPNAEVEKFRNLMGKIWPWYTTSNSLFPFYADSSCKLAYAPFAMGGGFGGDSTGPTPNQSDPQSGKHPDLTLSDIFVANGQDKKSTRVDETMFGTKLWVHAKIKSKNHKTDTSFVTRFYQSDGTNFDGKDDAVKLSDEQTKKLGKENTKHEYTQIDEIEYPGIYSLNAWVDATKHVTETNENNNFESDDHAVIKVRGNVDVSMLSIQTNKQVYALGETAQVYAQLQNFGPHPIGKTSYLDYYLDGALLTLPNGKERMKREHMKPGMIKNEDASIPLPPFYGIHEIKACFRLSGSDTMTTETNPVNNCIFTNVDIPEPIVLEPINLQAFSVTLPQEVATGTIVNPTFSLKRIGGTLDTPVRMDVYVNTKKVGEKMIDADALNDTDVMGAVFPGMKFDTVGTQDISACFDIPQAIMETDEGDNCMGKTMQVTLNTSTPGSVVFDSSVAIKSHYDQLIPETSCAAGSEPSFSIPTVEAGDIGATVFGSAKQRVFIPDINISRAKTQGTWVPFPEFDPKLITKWCFVSDTAGWSPSTSKSCGTLKHENTYWYADIPASDADKGSWAFVQNQKEYFVPPHLYSNLPLDSDGHIRYGNWSKPMVTFTGTGVFNLQVSFGGNHVAGYIVPQGVKLTGMVHWINDVDAYPGVQGKLYCDDMHKLRILIPDVMPNSTGRIVLDTTIAHQYVWQTTNQWLLPPQAVLVGTEGDYRLPGGSVSVKRQVMYDYGAKRLTLTIRSNESMKTAFGSGLSLEQISSVAWFSSWTPKTVFMKGVVSRSTEGIWTIVFENVPHDIAGNTFLVLSDGKGTKAWQNIAAFSFPGTMMPDFTKGSYKTPQ